VAGGVGAFSECRIAGRGERGETVGIILGMQCNGKGVTALLMSGVTFEHIFCFAAAIAAACGRKCSGRRFTIE
jgi:hypothetical protein